MKTLFIAPKIPVISLGIFDSREMHEKLSILLPAILVIVIIFNLYNRKTVLNKWKKILKKK